jgi:hypothetical protein
MRHVLSSAIIALAIAGVASAQDTKTRSRTEIKGDDAKIVSMTGCLRQDPLTSAYVLQGSTTASGDKITTNSTVKTDVDHDKTTVRGKSQTKADGGAVATGGALATYMLVPGDNIDLASHVGQQVQVSAIVVKAGHGTADVTVRDKTKVDPDNAPDSKSQSKTKLELPRSTAGAYTVMSVSSLGGTCVQ